MKTPSHSSFTAGFCKFSAEKLLVYEKMINIATDIEKHSSMKSKEVISALSGRMNWTSREVTEMLSALGSAIGTKLMEGDSVYMASFGQFEVRKKMERISVNPANGKRYLVPPKLVPVFKPGATVKNRLKELEKDE